MFRKILVANRGEIAIRIMRTARKLGVATVAVYSEADRDALHVEAADEAVAIGPAPAAASYLSIEKIVEACRATGADAVHPGYGFLSERAAFAEALIAAGVTFIGPNPKAIAALGDKIASKKLAVAAGVPTVPGHAEAVGSEEEAVAIAAAVGFPAMIKASAGGGGKGMRIARSAAEVAEGFRLSRSEAISSFGDGRIFIERFVENPRHIEVQVLGDRHGSVIHLGERECSVQRRNQKVVEEAPSPAVDHRLRAEMGAAAVRLAEAVGYDSAGTVEFIVDDAGKFYFLEMNTRLQVEHPVTEFVTGVDLVEEMIRSAAGETLRLRQADVALRGWAVEARLYAEDPYRDFLPSIGRLRTYRPPPEGRTGETELRIDSGVAEGSAISIHYDPMIAKIVTHGPDRDAAVAAMSEALDAFVVEGVAHNKPFLSALMDHPRWREGRLSTSFIAEEFPSGFRKEKPSPDVLRKLAVVATSIALCRAERLRSLPGRLDPAGGTPRQDFVVKIAGDYVPVRVPKPEDVRNGVFEVAEAGGGDVTVVFEWRPGDRLWTGAIGGEPLTVQVGEAKGGLRLSWRAVDEVAMVLRPEVAELDRIMPERRAPDGSKQLRCPMPGLVAAIAVEAGQAVRAGEALCIVEAMKMENVLRADRDATVKRVLAKPGDILAVDAVILEFA